MKYVFEKAGLKEGMDPKEVLLDEKEFQTPERAVKHALEIDADYVWAAPADRNPVHVWRRGESFNPPPGLADPRFK